MISMAIRRVQRCNSNRCAFSHEVHGVRDTFDCMYRRRFLMSAAFAGLLKEESAEPQTFVYKKAEGCDIEADVFSSNDSARKPVAVWIHGGALIQGSRKLPPDSRILRALLEQGFGVVSIGYRLAPETKLSAII